MRKRRVPFFLFYFVDLYTLISKSVVTSLTLKPFKMVQTQLELQTLTRGSQPWVFPKALDFPYQAIQNALSFQNCAILGRLQTFRILDGIERVYRNKIFSDFPHFCVTIFEKKIVGGGGGGPFLKITVKYGEPIAQNPFFSPKIFQKWNSHVEMFSFSQA